MDGIIEILCLLLPACFAQIMVASTATFLAAGKFGLAPTVKRGTDAACRLVDRPNAVGLITNDPSGAQQMQPRSMLLGRVLVITAYMRYTP